MAKTAKEKAESPEELEKMLLNYLVSQNRPYNLNDLHCNLKLRASKTVVNKVISSMSEKKMIHGKQYGKQWIFAPIQASTNEQPDIEREEESEDDMNKRIESLSVERETLATDVSGLSSKLSGLLETPTNEFLVSTLEKLQKENIMLTGKLEKLRSQTGDMEALSSEDLAALETQYSTMRKEWATRKRLFNNVMGTLRDCLSGSLKDLYEKMGIETDEDNGVDIRIDPLATEE